MMDIIQKRNICTDITTRIFIFFYFIYIFATCFDTAESSSGNFHEMYKVRQFNSRNGLVKTKICLPVH
jgi:hypothetical protein